MRADSGFFSKDVAFAALANGADFTICAKRTGAAWRNERQIPEDARRPAKGTAAEVAPCHYVPAGWPEGTRTIVRRVEVGRGELSGDTRSRRRRTSPSPML